MYETGRGGDHKSEDFKKDNMSSLNDQDVNEKTAKATGNMVSAKTIQRARAYVKPEGKYNVIYADPPWDIGSIELEKVG